MKKKTKQYNIQPKHRVPDTKRDWKWKKIQPNYKKKCLRKCKYRL